MRVILGVVIGVAVGLGLVIFGDFVNHRIWPPPADVRVTNPDAMRDYMATAPLVSLLGLPVTWTVAAFASSLAAARVGNRTWAGWIAGGALFAATCANLALIPHPLWMLIAALIAVPLAVWLGSAVGGARETW